MVPEGILDDRDCLRIKGEMDYIYVPTMFQFQPEHQQTRVLR
jgi:hypothetical protein